MCGYAPVAAVDGCTTAHWSRSGWRDGLAPSVVGTPLGSLAKARRISSELGELVWHGWRAPVHSVFLPPTGVRGATTARPFSSGGCMAERAAATRKAGGRTAPADAAMRRPAPARAAKA